MGKLNVVDSGSNLGYMSYRGLSFSTGAVAGEPHHGLNRQVYQTASDESMAADSGVFEASNEHRKIGRKDSTNSGGSYVW